MRGLWRGLAGWCCALCLGGALSAAEPVRETSHDRSHGFGASMGLETFDAAWGIIHETFHDPTFGGVDWEGVRSELRPKAEAAKDNAELRLVIEDMLSRLGKSHMALIPADVMRKVPGLSSDQPGPGSDRASRDRAGKGGSRPDPDGTRTSAGKSEMGTEESSGRGEGNPGMEVRMLSRRPVVVRVTPDGAAARAGVRPGWMIDAMEGQPWEEMMESLSWEKNTRQAEFLAWRMVTGKLSGQPGSEVSIRFLDGLSKPAERRLVRGRPLGEPMKLGLLPPLYAKLEQERVALNGGGFAGVLRFNMWLISVTSQLDEAIDQFRQADGMVMDLRGNLGGLAGMILGVSGHFLNDRISLGTLKMRGNELKFYANPRRVNPAGERVEPYARPLAILIDSLSLSAAEIFAGGMQAVGRARIFGETSGGQALPAIWDRLPNGDLLYHAFGDFVTAAGAEVEGRGVVPDEVVVLTRDDLLAGRDAPLRAAVEWIERQSWRGAK